MPDLGSFGTPRDAPEPDTFMWFGVQVRTNPDVSDLDVADFMEQAGGMDADDPNQAVAGMVAIKTFCRAAIHPDDFGQFWALGRANHQELRDLMEVTAMIVATTAERPTGQPSASTDGLAPTPERSPSGIARSVYPARPDLRLAVERAVEPLSA